MVMALEEICIGLEKAGSLTYLTYVPGFSEDI
jgi:hypothetical protein